MANPICVAVDGMGGDKGLSVTEPAVLEFISQHQNAQVAFFAPLAQVSDVLKNHPRIRCVESPEVVAMDADPLYAIKNQKQSSMRLALESLAAQETQVCVSAGNTGVLMGLGRFVLRMFPGVERPAIMGVLPTQTLGRCLHMLDLGASVDASAEQLLQFATMGTAAVQVLAKVRQPRVGLLNIGHEMAKGTDKIKQTSTLLEENKDIHYVGFIEASDLFLDRCDVLVCDGFVGNSVLKACEGTMHLIFDLIKKASHKNCMTKLAGLGTRWLLSDIKNAYHPDVRNGAFLLGLKETVIKSHGGSGVRGFTHALNVAYCAVEQKITQRVGQRLTSVGEA